MSGTLPDFSAELPVTGEVKTLRWRHWILAAVLALAFHASLFFPPIPGLFKTGSSIITPPRVDLNSLDPKKLQAIRNKWRANDRKEKQLLLGKNKSAPSDTRAPTDARYMSDRNIRVEKEQRSNRTITLPKDGAPGTPGARMEAEKAPRTKPAHRLPSLGNLGVPLPAAPKKQQSLLAEKAVRPAIRTQQAAGQEGNQGGEQYVNDADLPQGSENLLNAQESVYYSFYARIYESIAPIWTSKIREAGRRLQAKLQPAEYITRIEAVLDSEGNLTALNQIESSGVADFDHVAIDSWRAVGKLPNTPPGLRDANGELRIAYSFSFQYQAGFGFQPLPPERSY